MRFNTIGRATAMNFLWGWDRNEFAKMGSPPDRISLASGTPSSYRGVMASQRRSKKCGGGGRWIDRSSGKKAKKEKQKKKTKKKEASTSRHLSARSNQNMKRIRAWTRAEFCSSGRARVSRRASVRWWILCDRVYNADSRKIFKKNYN